MDEPFEIAHWLESLGLEEYAGAFHQNHIDAEALSTITSSELKELGVESLGHRKRLLAAIARLRSPEAGLPLGGPAPSPISPEPAPLPAAAVPSPPSASLTPPSPETPAAPEQVAASHVARVDSPASSQHARPPVPDRPEAEPAKPAPRAIENPPSSRLPFWTRVMASKFLLVSIIAHLLFALGATYYIVQRTQGKRKVTFQGGPPAVNASKRALEHKVSLAKKKNTGGAPPQAKRIVSAGIAKISLPDMPSIPTSTTMPGMKASMGGAGFGAGMGFGQGAGSSMGGGGAGGGGGMTLFGFRGAGVGLQGTFYDFKRDTTGKPTGLKNLDRPSYTAIIHGFVDNSMWGPPGRFRHHTSPAQLSTKAIMIPIIRDTEAGKAFQDPDAGPGLWLAHYSGTVTPTVSGEYRFVNYCDNAMVVGFNGRVVFDGSDPGYLKRPRTPAGQVVNFPGASCLKNSFESEWFTLSATSSFKLDIIIGDEGGEFGTALFLQKKGETYGRGRFGLPQLPLVLFAPLTEADKTFYRKWVDDVAFSGPVFSVRSGGSGFGSLLPR